MAEKLQTIPECDLGFVEVNSTQSSTILFIHGALSSPLEASLITPHLQDYHVLIPALHKNVKQLDPRPSLTFPTICSQLAQLIRHRAKNSQVHIYGHSMGAHLALHLAMLQPTLVSTVIASGVALISHFPQWKRAIVPHYLYTLDRIPQLVLPRKLQVSLFNSVFKPASTTLATKWVDNPAEGGWTECKEMSASFNESLPPGEPVDVKARTLIVAGTGAMGDSIEDAKWVAREIRNAGGEAQGAEIKMGGHPWILQFPELAAELIKAWIEGRELPNGASSFEPDP